MQAAERVAALPLDGKRHLMVVDDDDLFRESIAQNLRDSGYSVEVFADGLSFLSYLADHPQVDLLLLDWKMPRMNGIEVLSHVRKVAPDLPVIFLTVLNDLIYEEAALLGGAVDFVDKSRSFTIIQRRIELIPGNRGEAGTSGKEGDSGKIDRGKLSLDPDSRRAYWDGQQIDLTLSEFGIVQLLAKQAGTDVPYREIYDIVRGPGFIAGLGDEGYRANVRSSIKRIRQKFRNFDDDFNCIENYPGFGYRWNDNG